MIRMEIMGFCLTMCTTSLTYELHQHINLRPRSCQISLAFGEDAVEDARPHVFAMMFGDKFPGKGEST